MSFTLPDIDLSVAVAPIPLVPPSNLQANQISYLRLLNESAYTLQLQAGGVNIPVPAWTDYPVLVSLNNMVNGGFALPIFVTQTLLGTPNPALSTILRVTFYSPGELPASTVPLALVRQTFIPNPVTSVGGGSVFVQDDGRTLGALTVEATPAGDPASAVQLTNTGLETLGNVNRNGSITLTGPSARKVIVDPSGIGLGSSASVLDISTAGTDILKAFTAVSFLINSISQGAFNQNGLSIFGTLDVSGSNAPLLLSNPNPVVATTNGTLSVPAGPVMLVSSAANVTNVTLSSGTLIGQTFLLVNTSGAGVTIAFNSSVRLNKTVSGGTNYIMYWNGTVWSATS